MVNKLSIVHKTAAMLALSLIIIFFTSSIIVELLGSQESILTVKTAILYGIGLLISAMAVTGITGAKLAAKRRALPTPLVRKKKRMPFVACNGLLVLTPLAIYLQHLANLGEFGELFYTLQGIELVAGGVNIYLMVLNIRDALALKRPSQH